MKTITQILVAMIGLFLTLSTACLAHPGHDINDMSGFFAHTNTDISPTHFLVLAIFAAITIYLLLRRSLR